jgi:FAD binding domain
MAQPQIALSALANFRTKFAGTVLQPGDPEYDNVRALFNGMVDKHPAVIARPRNDDDIVAAIAFAREHRLEIAVRGGGHNVGGRASVEGGMMIDLSRCGDLAIVNRRQRKGRTKTSLLGPWDARSTITRIPRSGLFKNGQKS